MLRTFTLCFCPSCLFMSAPFDLLMVIPQHSCAVKIEMNETCGNFFRGLFGFVELEENHLSLGFGPLVRFNSTNCS